MIWIPVLDSKPEEFQQVLVFDDLDEFIIGYFHEAGGFFIGSVDGARISKARFWRPLPEPPVRSGETFLNCRLSKNSFLEESGHPG